MQNGTLLAAVDLGSNSFRLQVARVVDDQIYPLDGLKETVRLAAGLGQGKLPEGEWLKGVELAGVGLDGLVGYNAKQQTRQDSTAVVSQLNAGAVQLNVRGALQDEGTRYRAGDGALNIKAASHNAIAASDSHQSSEQGVEARLGLRVYTTTGEDVNLRANGAGKYQRAEETRSSAQVGRYAGSQGVSIQTRNDARYAGGEFDGGAGDVSLKAGGTLALTASRSASTSGGRSLQAWALSTRAITLRASTPPTSARAPTPITPPTARAVGGTG